MVEWVSSGSERTFDQSAANGRKEPNSTEAALCANVWSWCMAKFTCRMLKTIKRIIERTFVRW